MPRSNFFKSYKFKLSGVSYFVLETDAKGLQTGLEVIDGDHCVLVELVAIADAGLALVKLH